MMLRTIRVVGAAALALLLPLAAWASEGGPPLDRAPVDLTNKASLQRGARTFANYCLNCHNASYMRYSRLTDLGLSEDEIKNNLILTDAKVGDTMQVVLDRKDAKEWFGVAPPDLSVEARSRGADWLYTYLRTYYRDPSRATGWNNLAFPNVGMPHVLYELQGEQILKVSDTPGAEGHESHGTLVLTKQGKLSPREYDQFVGDLVNYLVFMGEPAKMQRTQIGVVVLFFLVIAFFVTLALKKEFWKDIH